ncbi:hypothetical protein CAFE_18700 [Caprobacter fermentans]|uniref:Uncharacterized protein n=1 Tax=Caproicibacter fermentans TaxID=2576756 RepID=A0A6N8I0V0_9FIRM|nr:hypothetical protein [Caproicibacter fermentans]MVB11163.1 hypothetical protein [Caproicibacter fermentans]
MDAKYLAEIKAREQAATPGPWVSIFDLKDFTVYDMSGEKGVIIAKLRNSKYKYKQPDADFIAHARTDMPELIAEVERLTDQHKCDVHNLSAMKTTLDQQAKNCEKLIKSYKESNLEQATENYELEKENAALKAAKDEINRYNIDCTKQCDKLLVESATLKKALELVEKDKAFPGGTADGTLCKKIMQEEITKYINQAQQTHETQEAEK